MIAASHPEEEPGVMRKAVGKSINKRSRQANPKVTATHCWIAQYAVNLVQARAWHFSVDVQEPENVAACRTSPSVHLCRSAAFASPDKLIAKAFAQSIGAVAACTVDDNNFSFRRALTEMREKLAYQRRFIKHRNNDRNLHCERSLTGRIEFA